MVGLVYGSKLRANDECVNIKLNYLDSTIDVTVSCVQMIATAHA